MTTNRRRRRTTADPTTAVAYLRVSTDEQAASGLGIDAQRAAVTTEAERRGLTIATVHVDEGISGSTAPEVRPALATALNALAAGEAGTLLVAKVDRLARSVLAVCRIMESAQHAGWALVAADGTVDLTTPHGRAMAQVTGVFAELERAMIAERTRAALAERKAAGARLGRPVGLADEVRQRIAADHAAGQTLAAIARTLTAERVPTARGGERWYPSTVRAVVRSVALDAEAAAATAAA